MRTKILVVMVLALLLSPVANGMSATCQALCDGSWLPNWCDCYTGNNQDLYNCFITCNLRYDNCFPACGGDYVCEGRCNRQWTSCDNNCYTIWHGY